MTGKEEKTNKYLWITFVIFLFLYILFTPGIAINVGFNISLLLILMVYLLIFNRFYILKNTFLLQRDESISTMILIVLSFILFVVAAENFPPEFSILILFQTLNEELVFRAFLLGILIEGIPLSKKNGYPFYWTEDRQNMIHIVLYILLISVIFSNLHVDWLIHNQNLLWRIIIGFILASAFVVTNKKIYAPWIVHYIYNVYVYS